MQMCILNFLRNRAVPHFTLNRRNCNVLTSIACHFEPILKIHLVRYFVLLPYMLLFFIWVFGEFFSDRYLISTCSSHIKRFGKLVDNLFLVRTHSWRVGYLWKLQILITLMHVLRSFFWGDICLTISNLSNQGTKVEVFGPSKLRINKAFILIRIVRGGIIPANVGRTLSIMHRWQVFMVFIKCD